MNGNRKRVTLLRCAAFVVMMMAWIGQGMAQQTVSEGLYYIGSRDYNASNTTTNYYLCPTEEWAYFQSNSPYYYLYSAGCNTDQPFMTTYQCRNGVYDSKKALWVVKNAGDGYWHVIHLMDGKYLTYNVAMGNSSNAGRMRVHLQEGADGDNALFQILFASTANGYSFVTKNYDSGTTRKYLNVTGASGGNGNQPSLQATSVRKDGPNNMWVGGIIGLWTSGASSEANGRWYPESTLLTAPSISEINQSNMVTVTDVNGLPAGYNIRYTISTDGNAPADPTATSDIMEGGSFLVENTCIIKAVVERYGVVLTGVATSGTLEPVPNTPSCIVNCDNKLEITCSNMPTAHIYYTTATGAGTPAEPTNVNGTLYEGPLMLASGTKVRARAYNPSETLWSAPSDAFTFHPAYSVSPTLTFTSATNVAISYSTTATIYYNITEDGSEPDTPSTTNYTGTGTANTTLNVTIDPTKQIRISAIAKEGSLLPSCAPATGWKLPQPELTTSCDDATLTITSSFPVYYTTAPDLGTPTTESTPYTEPITGLTVGDRLNILAIDSQNHTSYLIEYTHAITHTAPPTIAMTNATTITITGPSGSTIYYTIDGDDPVIGGTGVISHSSPATVGYTGEMMDIRAIAKVSSLEPSCVTRLVTIGAPTITISEDDCSTASPRGNVVTIPIPDEGTIWYAVTAGQGTTAPDPSAIPNPYSQYTEPIAIDDLDGANTHYTVHAYANSNDGNFNSTVTSESREMKTGGKPVLTEPTGSNPVVVISGGVFGDVAICSATGVATQNIPIASDGTAEYTIAPEATGTLTVVFKHGNWLTSCEATFVLPSAPATPTWSQDCANLLSLHCATPMADIHYTTDDTEPTLESPTYTSGCMDNLAFGTLVRAKAFVGFRASGELNFTYNPTHSATPQFFVEGTLVTISVPNHPEATIYYELSTNGDQTMPIEPDEATTSSTLYNEAYTLTGITIFSAIAVYGGLEPSCPVRVVTREGYSINSAEDLNKLSTYPDKYFFVFNDVNASGYTTTVQNFSGVIEGNGHTISNLTAPLIKTATDAVIHDLTLDNVQINITANNTHAGAFAQTANGNTRIYNCGIIGENSSVSGTKYVGGLVGLLDGYARVINCFSYAYINGGTHRAGIVGYNNYASKSGDLRTMVMNCMFYGDINSEGATSIAPVYGGKNIHNKQATSNSVPDPNNTGLNNYCYFYYHGDYVNHITVTSNDNQYHGSLGAEERFLNRFEFFRMTLNSTRNMAAYYVSGDATETGLIAKWVLDKSIAPYPILKSPGYYPSVVNPDAEHAVPIDPDNVHYNEGRKLGTLTVNIQKGNGGAVFNNNDYSSITTDQLILNVIDKDPNNFNFNYKKIQLPYYNQVGSGNYTHDRVVTGWKIVAISPSGSGSFTTTTADYPDWNFVDRTCTDKDLYSVSGRVFNQGAYWEVPDGVTSITIEPYWAKAAYLSDTYYDMTYINGTKYGVTIAGTCPTIFNEQTVNTAKSSAISALSPNASHTVYDYAVVLVGNYHQYEDDAIYNDATNKPVTFMSADLDGDCEPDNTLFYYHNSRRRVAPIRFDFLNMPGIGTVKRTHDSNAKPEPGIFKPTSWFEITNTVFIRCGQFEYCDGTGSVTNQCKLYLAPLILQGGIYEQFVSSFQGDAPDLTNYILVGGNAWFKNFANGCHTNTFKQTHKVPINVAGGDYENFYLTGIYQPNGDPYDENAECYIDGGRFGEVAGAGMQRVDGSVTWLINAADMGKFFGGGINPAQSITDDVTTTISNSRVDEYYGGPKFGDMHNGKRVTTTATNCRFGLFFGAGHGGTSFNRVGCEDATIASPNNTAPWGTYVGHYTRSYEVNHIGHNNTGGNINYQVNAISTSYEYEYILHSDGAKTVARFFVNFAKLSLASTQDVFTNLTGCNIGTFYGGGRLGAVKGNVTSTLTDCTVEHDAFGSGFSAEAPTIMVMNTGNFITEPKYNRKAGVFNDAEVEFPASVQYTWANRSDGQPVAQGTEFDHTNHLIFTDEPLSGLGAVYGNATLTIQGNSLVKGDVYGGGAMSSSNTNSGTTTVNILGGTYGVVENNEVTGGNIYGGGMGNADNAVTEGIVEVNIGNASQEANNVVINGSVYGCNNANGSPTDNVTVHIYKTKHDSNNIVTNLTGGHAIKEVFGGGNQAHYQPTTEGKKTQVHVHYCDNTIQYLYGGGNAANVGTADINSATDVIIDGGRILWVFGGGNGFSATNNHTNPGLPNYNPGANIYGNTGVTFHAGYIYYLFGGSNEWGAVSGNKNMSLDNDGTCSIDNHIVELYGGNNKAPTEGNISLTMICQNNPCPIDYLFGGSRDANITGNVELTVKGGDYRYVFGGNNRSGIIGGNVTLNLNGGIIREAAFGGNKGGGSIQGDITVYVEDLCECPLDVNNVFGAGDQAIYEAPTGGTAREFNPIVYVNHICGTNTIRGNVYGGGNGDPESTTQEPGMVTGKPQVIIGDLTAGHEDYRAAISGNVYGGGNAAKVDGATTVLMQKANSTVGGALYGGGNQAGVSGTATVTMTLGQVATGIYGGCNTSGTVNGAINVYVNGGTVGSSTTHADGVYGGGFGADTGTGDDVTVTIGNSDGTPEIYGDVYGGSAKGDVNLSTATTPNTTKVWLKKGTITGDIYGGGYGLDNEEALVYGNVIVLVSGGTVNSYTSGTNTLGGRVFGCNNVNGTPKGMVDVTIDATNPSTGTGNEKVYALQGVYGGGNLAAYEPTTPYQNGTTVYPKVTINGCTSSVKDVYGGGNAAPVPNSKVVINGGDIKRVFAGGNGESGTPAHIGWKNTDPAPTSDAYGTGQASAEINGGTILQVFGGSNANGVIRTSSAVNVDKSTASGACDMVIGEVYGGGNEADGNAGTITIGCTGTLTDDHSTHPENIGTSLEGIGYVYGGANQADINNDITLDINSGIVGNVFGGNNTSGAISGTITVNIEKDESNTATCPDDWYVGDVYGGGNHADYNGTPDVNIINGLVSGSVYGGGNDITDGTKGVRSSDVEMTGGTVLGGIYGGCNEKGTVTTNSVVNILGGTIGSQALLDAGATADVFGGGLGENTKVNGNVTVTISRASGANPPDAPIIYGDVYGGSAKGEVNTGSTNTTRVDILDGTLVTKTSTDPGNSDIIYYTGGNVFGGGLGESGNANNGKVNGKVVVNIGAGIPDQTNPFTVQVPANTLSGNAIIGGNVYGCNNSGGSPQDDVTVNIFQTAHTDGTNGTPNNTLAGDAFAIANVFGGGNEANFSPATDKKTYVNIYTCNNTIGRLFGGGNAAATPEIVTHIQGGRFSQVFGGGNGERGEQYGANVNGDVTLNLHGGTIGEYYGGSNQNGTISGTIHTNVLNDGPCESVTIDDFFCGGNFVDIFGDLVTTIACSDARYTNLYGGCNQANIYGNVILNLCGGTYTNVFGGSKGVANGISADILAVTEAVQAEHPDLTVGYGGNVTLNLYGGTITNVYGGSNINGNIEGKITVNVLDDEGDCPLYVTNIYGGSNLTDYEPTDVTLVSPVVNLVHAKYGISGNVYGGSKGNVNATPPTKVTANPLVNIGYDASSMSITFPSDYPATNTLTNFPRAIVAGSVFGGGDAAKVVGNTAIFLRNRAKVFGNVYGGGNMGEVSGNTKVIVNGQNQ